MEYYPFGDNRRSWASEKEYEVELLRFIFKTRRKSPSKVYGLWLTKCLGKGHGFPGTEKERELKKQGIKFIGWHQERERKSHQLRIQKERSWKQGKSKQRQRHAERSKLIRRHRQRRVIKG